MIRTAQFEDRPDPAATGERTARFVAAGSVLSAGILLLTGVGVVEFAAYLGLATISLAVAGDIYQRLGRFDLFSASRH